MSEQKSQPVASGSVFAEPLPDGRPPRQVLEHLWLFSPNRETLGGSAWWLETPDLDGFSGLLIDCPGLSEANLDFLRQCGPGRLVLTSRDGHGRTRRFQDALGWPVSLQEQEAYLLPNVARLEPFATEHSLGPGYRLRWTPGPTPGSCVVHAPEPWNVLFCGRLLVPVAVGALAGLQHRRTFHWPRQQRSLERLQAWVGSDPLPSLASGAGLGALRGEHLVPWSGWRHHSPDGAQSIGSA